jgi:polyferredoxin
MKNENQVSLSIANPHPVQTDWLQKIGLAFVALGVLILFVAFFGVGFKNNGFFLALSLGGIAIGTSVYGYRFYHHLPVGIKNNKVWTNSLSNRGIVGWIIGIILTGFYILLYFSPENLGLNASGNTGLVALFDPFSVWFSNKPASQWFVYGTLYTLCILSLGVKFIFKYRNNRYQLLRTIVVIASQLFLAYLIPEILEGLNSEKAYFTKDLKYFWPLNYAFFDEWHLNNMNAGGSLGMVFLVWGILGFLIVTPVLTYFVGKRWYCSWVCGCGGLAETAGDSFRQLSSKKLSSWKLERWLIHSILILITMVTAIVLYGYFKNVDNFFGLSIYTYFSKPYGFFIGSIFSGVIGVGFYPILGNRVWCRFGCPMAAYMGLFQRFKSRFRITTNGGQCISCGNCSTYCEQGIDVRAYAQKGENIVRSSCVGCGICSAVCPRGVLNLENGSEKNRINSNPIIIEKNSIKLNVN